MNRKIKSNRQTIAFAVIAAIVIFVASVSTFAQSATDLNRLAFGQYFTPTAKQNLWLNNSFVSEFSSLTARPKPDFSAMEEWFEIVRYEYGDAAVGDNKLYIIVKPKAEKRPRGGWAVQFRDKDGILVRPNDSRYGNGLSGPSALTPVGEPEKIYCYTPGESDMERVVSATVVRIKE